MFNFKSIFKVPQQRERGIDLSIFNDIIGYEDIKHELVLALASEYRLNMLLNGKPGNGKSTFLTLIEQKYKKHAKYLDCVLMTKAGLRDFLFSNQGIKILLLDEISRLPKIDQGILLNLMERGSVIDGRAKKMGQEVFFKDLKIFCTSNNYNGLIAPLQDRFDTLHMPDYTYDEFEFICTTRLKKFTKDPVLIEEIISAVYRDLHSTSIRDAIDITKRIRNRGELVRHIQTKKKYSKVIK